MYEHLNEDPSENADLEPSEDRATNLEEQSEVLTTNNLVNSDRFIKKKWKKWKKKAEKRWRKAKREAERRKRAAEKRFRDARRAAEKRWRKAKRAAEEKYRRAKKAAEKKWRGIRKMRDWKKLRRISWRDVSKAWRRIKGAGKRSGEWMKKNFTKEKLKEISKEIRRAARRNRKWFEQKTKFLPKPVRWFARKWYKFSQYSLDGLSIRWRLYRQFVDATMIATMWWNPCGWASIFT